jgi:hypothetical protein
VGKQESDSASALPGNHSRLPCLPNCTSASVCTLQIGVEGQIAVRRDQIGVVIGGCRIHIVAACRLNADQRLAEPMQRQGERIARDLRIVLWRTPALGHLMADRFGQRGKKCAVGIKRQALPSGLRQQ